MSASSSDLQIVFENEHFVVCDKQAGVLSTPSRHEDEDNRRCLGRELETHLGIQIFPVHRLDFEVSGLVLYAKNAEAHRKSNGWFENKTVSKTYSALSTGQEFSHIPVDIKVPRKILELEKDARFEWKCSILRGKRRSYESPHGKPSLTIATYKGREGKYHSWNLEPVTGRPHQLRFELSRHGFPIVGDKLYGSREDYKGADTIALRAFKIDFTNAPGSKDFGLPQIIEI